MRSASRLLAMPLAQRLPTTGTAQRRRCSNKWPLTSCIQERIVPITQTVTENGATSSSNPQNKQLVFLRIKRLRRRDWCWEEIDRRLKKRLRKAKRTEEERRGIFLGSQRTVYEITRLGSLSTGSGIETVAEPPRMGRCLCWCSCMPPASRTGLHGSRPMSLSAEVQ
ncbi:hypothetical protein GE09DRAFT_211316 [Coniochaeta sp. 2T2.1]|nr:hypothetical protein GE09DRAFT_211316 [Coniochaeta sp. 2T2.1]